MADSTKKHQIEIESHRNMATRSIFVSEELSLLSNLIENQIEIDHSCGGNGTCGTCCIEVVEGLSSFSEVVEIESEMKSERGYKDHERLSCQSHILGPVKIKIP